MKRAGWIAAAAVVVALAAWLALRGRTEAAEYRLVEVERGDLTAVVSSTGALQAVTTVEVGTQVSGQVSEILVDFNVKVRKGELIARIDPTILEQEVRASSAALAKREAEMAQKQWQSERADVLFRDQLIPESDHRTAKAEAASARADLEAARIALERARRNLTYTEIRSPIDGVVVERNVQVGQTVAASLSTPVLFRIAEDLSRLQILVSVDESDIGKIHPAQAAEFTVQAYPEQRFRGAVSQVRLQSTTTENVVSYGVVVDVANPGLRLVPGMTATVEFIVAEAKNVLKVPNAALRVRPTEAMRAQLREAREVRETRDGVRAAEGRTGSQEGNRRGAQSRGPESGPGRADRAGAGSMAILWVADEEGKNVRPLRVRTGLTDGQETEIAASDLREGMQVVAGIVHPDAQGTGSSPFQSQQQGGPGRGPGGPGGRMPGM
jgi:HlyD family secretion protein